MIRAQHLTLWQCQCKLKYKIEGFAMIEKKRKMWENCREKYIDDRQASTRTLRKGFYEIKQQRWEDNYNDDDDFCEIKSFLHIKFYLLYQPWLDECVLLFCDDRRNLLMIPTSFEIASDRTHNKNELVKISHMKKRELTVETHI